jgi:hypothetical protein
MGYPNTTLWVAGPDDETVTFRYYDNTTSLPGYSEHFFSGYSVISNFQELFPGATGCTGTGSDNWSTGCEAMVMTGTGTSEYTWTGVITADQIAAFNAAHPGDSFDFKIAAGNSTAEAIGLDRRTGTQYCAPGGYDASLDFTPTTVDHVLQIGYTPAGCFWAHTYSLDPTPAAPVYANNLDQHVVTVTAVNQLGASGPEPLLGEASILSTTAHSSATGWTIAPFTDKLDGTYTAAIRSDQVGEFPIWVSAHSLGLATPTWTQDLTPTREFIWGQLAVSPTTSLLVNDTFTGTISITDGLGTRSADSATTVEWCWVPQGDPVSSCTWTQGVVTNGEVSFPVSEATAGFYDIHARIVGQTAEVTYSSITVEFTDAPAATTPPPTTQPPTTGPAPTGSAAPGLRKLAFTGTESGRSTLLAIALLMIGCGAIALRARRRLGA